MPPPAPLKTYCDLDADEIARLAVVTQAEFERIVDMLYQTPCPDYRRIPNVIRLPSLRPALAAALGITCNIFFLKANVAHIRPQRKARYNQSLRIEEMKRLPAIIARAESAYIDTSARHQNFILAEADEADAAKSNKIVFNKDVVGNYIVTVSKIDTGDLCGGNYIKVGAGVAPAIRRP